MKSLMMSSESDDRTGSVAKREPGLYMTDVDEGIDRGGRDDWTIVRSGRTTKFELILYYATRVSYGRVPVASRSRSSQN